MTQPGAQMEPQPMPHPLVFSLFAQRLMTIILIASMITMIMIIKHGIEQAHHDNFDHTKLYSNLRMNWNHLRKVAPLLVFTFCTKQTMPDEAHLDDKHTISQDEHGDGR